METKQDAREQNLASIRVLFDILKGTLGPKGTDKLLTDQAGNITVTNDGVTILQELNIEHPVAKMMVSIAQTQEKEVGDGTTTVILYAGEFLEKARELIKRGIHPTTILSGYKLAKNQAIKILKNIISKPAKPEDYLKLIETTITGKGTETIKQELSEVILNSFSKFGYDNLKIIKIIGDPKVELINGITLNEIADFDRKELINPKVALIDFDMDNKDTDRDTQLTISNAEDLDQFLNKEKEFLEKLIEKIKSEKINAIFSQKGINDLIVNELKSAGILCIKRINKFDMDKLEKTINLKKSSSIEKITGKNIQKIRIEKEYIFVENKFSEVGTICIYGSTKQTNDEIKRAITDGLGVINSLERDPFIIAGGGAVEIELSKQLKEFANTFSGREQLAIEKFAESFECIPEILSENAGLDKIEIVAKLKTAHKKNKNFGINILKNKIEDMFQSGIIEPYKVKSQAINSAFEITNSVLRISDLLISKDNSKNQV